MSSMVEMTSSGYKFSWFVLTTKIIGTNVIFYMFVIYFIIVNFCMETVFAF